MKKTKDLDTMTKPKQKDYLQLEINFEGGSLTLVKEPLTDEQALELLYEEEKKKVDCEISNYERLYE